MRQVLFVAFALTACTPFEPAATAVTDAGATDAGTTEAGASEQPDQPEQPDAGNGCADRVPTPNLCDDYEHGLPTPNIHPGGTLTIGTTGSGSAHGLHATVEEGIESQAYADYAIPSPETLHYVAFNYDLHVDAAFAPDTEIVQFYLPIGDTFCALQTRLSTSGAELDFVEFCSGKSQRQIAAMTLPVNAAPAYWVNINVAVDFTSKDVVISLRANNATQMKPGKITLLTLGKGAAVEPGIGYYKQPSRATALDVDNLAIFWH